MQAPTDNLYKFLAIAGMLCFIYFFFDFNKRSDELEGKLDALSMQQAEFLATVDALTEWATVSSSNIKSDFMDNPTIEEGEQALKKLTKSRDEIALKFRELTVVNAKLNKSIDIAKDTFDRLKDMSIQYRFYQSVSLFIATIGVWFWYFRTQKYLDLKEKQVSSSSNP
ncbi:hypothetical protein [Pseudomonas alkylphenolica]|uniref:hypothetical protein n=1 Tax=Pseudomonas alkylphenolica TaxID=237609 RepID=UPI00315D2E74